MTDGQRRLMIRRCPDVLLFVGARTGWIHVLVSITITVHNATAPGGGSYPFVLIPC